jgi:hypothetical protein
MPTNFMRCANRLQYLNNIYVELFFYVMTKLTTLSWILGGRVRLLGNMLDLSLF